MIRATFTVNENAHYVAFHMEGHADFDVHGKDIVCAGASAIAYGIFNSIFALTNTKPEVEIKDGLMDVQNIAETNDVQLLMKSLEVSLKTVEEEYSEYISISKRRGE